MNGGCHAVGPRPLAPRYERFGVILYCDPDLEVDPFYLGMYSVMWGTFISDLEGVRGEVFPVQYGADVNLSDMMKNPVDAAWVKALHAKTIETRGAWNTHLERFIPEHWREPIFEPLKSSVDKALWKHWNPDGFVEWLLANIG